MNSSLFQKSDVIKLKDKDFKITQSLNGGAQVKLKHKDIKNKDGYVMIFASWCPHCQSKEQFWSYLATKLNKDPTFAKENFRICIIDSQDPASEKVVQALEVGPIPKFMHIICDPKNPTEADLRDYNGDISIEGFLKSACEESGTNNMCNVDRKKLNPPQIGGR